MADVTRALVYSHEDAFLFELAPADVFARIRTERINGEHSWSVTTTTRLSKGMRVLTCDATGKWREWVVTGEDAEHTTGALPYGTYYCVWSLQYDLSLTRVSKMPGVKGSGVLARAALEAALSGTRRWAVGTVTRTTVSGASMYDMSGWEALAVLVKHWGGELDALVEVGQSGVVARSVCLYDRMGASAATRRFDYGHDLKGVRREVSDAPLACRILPRGRGEETEDGYGRKVTIADANGGVEWLQNDDAVPLARVPDGQGGYEYPTVIVENGDIEDPAELKEWGLSVLEEHTTPQVTYTLGVTMLTPADEGAHGVALGDPVQCVDREFGEGGLRVEARVIELVTDELDESNSEATVGSVTTGLDGWMSRIAELTETVRAMNGGTLSTAGYLAALLERLNGEINATGGYTYIVPGHGMRTYDKAVSDPTVGSEADAVVEVKGGTIRIANSRTQGGEWDWRTVFTSGRIAAEVVVAANLTAGYIGSEASGNYWNLDTGEARFGGASTLGGRTVTDILEGIDATVRSVSADVQYAESQSSTTPPVADSASWSSECPAWREGYYIWQRTVSVVTTDTGATTTVSTPACISGREGVDGVGIATTAIEYGTSASASTQPASWSGNVPASIAQGAWLWVRTTQTRTDGSESVTYTKSYAGTDGQDGRYVAIQSSEKSGDTTTVVLAETDPETGETTTRTLTIKDGEDGQNGTDGKTGYVHIAWATSSDGSKGFSTTESSGKTYIGAYTDNTKADSTSYKDYSWSLIKGADGTSVTVSKIEYGTSASASTAPASYGTAVPTSVAKGTWLWVRTTYSDGSVATAKSYVGTDGEDGKSVFVQNATKTGDTTTVELSDGTNTTTLTIKDGQDGSDGSPGTNGLSGYVHVAWANSADGSKDFSTSASAGKSYLGTYTDNTKADSTSYKDYSWSLIKGADGNDGDDGVGVSAVVEQYYLSTSSTAQSGGSWGTAQPAWVKGKYIWTRSRVTWTNGDVTTTAPVLAAAVNGANEAASDARKYADNFITDIDSTGIFVHPSASTERGVGMNPTDGLYFTEGGVVVARYTANLIELAKNSSTAVISMLGGAATIKATSEYLGNGISIQSVGGSRFYWEADGTSSGQRDSQFASVGVYSNAMVNNYLYPQALLTAGDNKGFASVMALTSTKSGSSVLKPPHIYLMNYLIKLYVGSGATGTITLSYDSAYFEMIRIYYRTNDSSYSSVDVYYPDGKTVCLTAVDGNTNTKVYMKRRLVSISGRNITNESYSELDINTNSEGSVISAISAVNHIYITRVEGVCSY